MLATQASIFNEVSNIYAPEYRQATFAAISTNLEHNSIQFFRISLSGCKEFFFLLCREFSRR